MKYLSNKIIILFLIVALNPGVWGASGQIRFTWAFGKRYVYLKDVAAYYGMKAYVGRNQCDLVSRYSKLIFYYDKKEGYLNGTKVYFAHAPFKRGGDAFVSEKDFLIFIDPILRYKAIPDHKMKLIMIDAGHGGSDEGGKGKRYKEKNIVLNIAQKVKQYLAQKNYRVIMTRDWDRALTLEQRTDMAKRQKADIFVSIHANIAGSSVKGIETFCLAPAGTASTHDSKAKNQKESGNNFDKNNSKLAYEIHKELVKRTQAVDRGVKHARFFVLKNASCPAVLIETGFLSNYYEERKLGMPSYQDAIARAIANGIIRYHQAMSK
jgi:N-acetylmuramoyl-L-alanine amidase